MTSSVYDIQGKPIKVGYLVAFTTPNGILFKGRVTALSDNGGVIVLWGSTLFKPRPHECVVLEEPVWPNTR